jgi:hypothetical protein
MPNYCPHCGAEQIDGSKFCSACGKKVKQHPETKKTPQLQQEEQNPAFVPLPTSKKSRKKLIIGITAIIVAVVIIVILILYFQGGTNPFSGPDSRFIGEWEENNIGSPLLWKFNSDSTIAKESSSGDMNNVGTWTVKDTQLCLNNTLCYTYEFSNNGSTLIMNRSGQSDIVLTKKDQQGASQTPNIKCITNSTTNRLIITSIDANVKWRDIEITTNPIATWQVQDTDKNQLAKISTTTTIVRYITIGDNILVLDTVGDVAVTLKYIPTNAVLGTWTVNV